ncbi:MAG: isopentenyl phosphate kinase [Sulfolobales archaeon]
MLRPVVLKIGGSLITDKNKPLTPRLDVMNRIAREIYRAWSEDQISIILIHGGGSFGHYMASKVLTERRIIDQEGFSLIAWSMTELNRLFTEKLLSMKLPVVQICTRGITYEWGGELRINLDVLKELISVNLIPVLFGDVIISERGFRILSGDDLAWRIAMEIGSEWVLFATNVEGIYEKPPEKGGREVIRVLRLSEEKNIVLGSSEGIDVTGGMLSKILSGREALRRGVKGFIFSGLIEDNIYRALKGYRDFGTVIVY